MKITKLDDWILAGVQHISNFLQRHIGGENFLYTYILCFCLFATTLVAVFKAGIEGNCIVLAFVVMVIQLGTTWKVERNYALKTVESPGIRNPAGEIPQVKTFRLLAILQVCLLLAFCAMAYQAELPPEAIRGRKIVTGMLVYSVFVVIIQYLGACTPLPRATKPPSKKGGDDADSDWRRDTKWFD